MEQALLLAKEAANEGEIPVGCVITDENGTKAAAMTEVMVMMTSAGPSAQPKIIELNRPFFYMIIENDTMTPLFMGPVYSME